MSTFFLPHASFAHPFCRVPSFAPGAVPLARGLDSRCLVLAIYRWYRTLSPRIDVHVDAAGLSPPPPVPPPRPLADARGPPVFDQRSGQLFVSLRQTFAIWFIPFYRAPVRLTTVLRLEQHAASSASSFTAPPPAAAPSLEARAAVAPLAGPGQERTRYFIAHQEDLYQANDLAQFLLPCLGPFLWLLWQLFSTALCAAGSLVLLPLYLFLNRAAVAKKVQ